jgi:hypothetical protein
MCVFLVWFAAFPAQDDDTDAILSNAAVQKIDNQDRGL